MNDVASTFRTAYDRIVDQMPAPPVFESLETRPTRSPSPPNKGLVVALGTAGLVVAIVGVAAWLSRPGSQEPAGTPSVVHTVAEYQHEVSALCEGGELFEEGEFDSYTLETWLDGAGGNSRGLVTYPDGSTMEVVRVGKSEGQVYVQGEGRGRLVGCLFGEDTILLATPQDDPFNSLAFGEVNLWSTAGTVNFSSTEVQDSPETFQDESLCQILDDPLGWLSEESLDFESNGGYCVGESDGRTVRIQVLTQLGTYFISDRDHRLSQVAQLNVFDDKRSSPFQQAQRSSIEGVGDALAAMTVVEEEAVQVPDDFFSTAGMTRLDGFVTLD